jgi:hypothetical protein
VFFHVIPAKAEIQCFHGATRTLAPGFHRGDEYGWVFFKASGDKGEGMIEDPVDGESRRMTKSEEQTQWKLVSPEAAVQIEGDRVNPHPEDLSGKTVVLYWNGKPNGDLFLNRIAELLIERVNNVKVVKAWEVRPSTKRTDPTAEASRTTAEDLAGLNPDLVIGAPGD